MQKHILSKTTFMYGCQCPKRLILHKYRKQLRNPYDEQQQTIFDAGTNIGELARKLFPFGVDATMPATYNYQLLGVEKTRSFINKGVEVIYEAAFQYEGVYCALDILVSNGDNWYAFEVKSTTSVKPAHVQDAALQYYVLTNCGITLSDISIIYLNNEYVRKGDLDIKQLFATESILADVLDKQEFVIEKVKELKALIAEKKEPIIEIGAHCFDPYECDFTNYCWAHMPKENSIFELKTNATWNLYAEGYRHLDDVPEDYELNAKAMMQLKHYRTGEAYIDREEIKKFLDPLTYPLYFFDFETIMPGVPEFDDSRPYQQIPFQFSLHVQKNEAAELEHHAFLGDGINDPRQKLTEVMIKALGSSGSIITYNMAFEKTRINELAELFPQYKAELESIYDRIVDLMVPFQKRWYYHPAFRGSYSIKQVLPALVPELSYKDLEIQEGGTASAVYSQLKFNGEARAAANRLALLAYCELDTLAMTRILDRLKEIVT